MVAALGDRPEAISAWCDWIADYDLDTADSEEFWILPWVYKNLLNANFSGPEKPRLAGIYKQMRLNSTIRLPRLVELTAQLQGAGIPALPGPLSTIALRDRQSAVPVAPAELLVPVKDLEAADQMLRIRGWASQAPLPDRRLRAFVPFQRYLDGNGLELNIRWRPFGLDSSLAADAGCWQRATTKEVLGRPVNLAACDDLLKMSERMDSALQAAVVASQFGDPHAWRHSNRDRKRQGSASLGGLLSLHWHRYRSCPKPDRPVTFASYLYVCHAHSWQTDGALAWSATALRKAAGRFF
jgi:hypothetical protein